MTSEIELFGKDSVKLNILKELHSGDINISLSMNGGVYQDYLSQIHREGSRMQVLGKFNLSEDPSGDVLTIRPIAVSGLLRVTFGFSGNAFENEKKLSIYRSATKSVERTYDIGEMLSSVEFIPQGNVKYLLRLTYGEPESDDPADHSDEADSSPASAQDSSTQTARAVEASPLTESLDDFDVFSAQPADETPSEPVSSTNSGSETVSSCQTEPQSGESDPELEQTQAQIKAAEEKLRGLRERRQSAKDLLKKLEAEYEKDYDEFGRELEEIKQQYGVDESVIAYYKDNDIQPIEDLLKEIAEKVDQAEKQISLVILGRQQKTMEIENEVKSNKRQ